MTGQQRWPGYSLCGAVTSERPTAGARGLGAEPAGPLQKFTRGSAPPSDHPMTLLAPTFHGPWKVQSHSLEVERTFFQSGQTWAQFPAEFPAVPCRAPLFKSAEFL